MKKPPQINARLQAVKILTSLLKQEGSLSTLLPNAIQQTSPRDRSLLQELCYGTCRWQPKLDLYLSSMLDKPLRKKDVDIHATLLLGLYQLSEMRIAEHAAISETVSIASSLKKVWAKKLINGILRRFQREKSLLTERLSDNPVFRTAHPEWILEAIKKSWPDQTEQIVEAANSRPPMTIRVNKQQLSREVYLEKLKEQGKQAQVTKYSDDGIQLEKACDVSELPGFENGQCSVQDEAAQLTAGLMQLSPKLKVLDACCAPGGKTGHLLEREPTIDLLAIDISPERIKRTQDNLTRLNLTAKTLEADAAQPDQWWDQQKFNRILLDAPCSATGVIRRHPDIKILREPANVAKLVSTQQALLHALWPLLVEDGLLIYATCSFFPQENTEQIANFLASHPDAKHQKIKAAWGVEQPNGRQILPSINKADGFYYCVLKKVSS